MPYQSRWSISLPNCSLPTLLFQSPTHELGSKLCFAEAARPDTHYVTREQFLLWVQRFALGLQRSKHFRKGDRILLFSGNDFFVPIVFLGVICAGGVFSGANPAFVARELAHQLKDSGATYLLCTDEAIDTGIEAARLAGLKPSERVFVYNAKIHGKETENIKGCNHWSALVASAEDARHFQWDDLTGPGECDATLALNYSSGTTGLSKGVEISHKNYIANILQSINTARQNPEYEKKRARASYLCFLPLYHAYDQTYYVSSAFYQEIPVYVMPKFNINQLFEYTEKFRITDYTLVPPIAVALAKSSVVDNYDLSSVERLLSAAAPLSRDISLLVEKRLGNRVNLKQGWGMTECTCSFLGWDDRKISTSNAVGEPIANCEAKLMDEDGVTEITTRGPQSAGELWCRGPNIMKGYWRNPKATAEMITPDRWLKTGDIAYVDDDGMFRIVDRKKELIKVKGNQVAPAELEALLLEHDDVAEAAVIGIPTDHGEEQPRAFIVPEAGRSRKGLSEAIIKFVEGKVVHYKRLTGGVEIVSTIPKNASGKIMRRQLRDNTVQRARQAGVRL